MKKLLFILLAMSIALVSCKKTESKDEENTETPEVLVVKTAQPRNVVLEEFTGIHCGWCPEGHQVAETINTTYPGRVVLINIHAGSYAVPSGNEPDFRTQWGDALVQLAQVTGYPTGTVNRTIYGSNTKLAMSRSDWPGAAQAIINSGNSPVNIGAKSKWNGDTRTVTVTVQLYYTASETEANKLNVVFLENHVFGYQASGGDNYDHKHIMRDLITGQFGENITTTSSGTEITRTYNYVVDASWNIDNCDISVFVTKSDDKTVHTGITIPAKNGTTAI
ncbi:Omp28-related outer membrane protein [Bacteroidota bacterium]